MSATLFASKSARGSMVSRLALILTLAAAIATVIAPCGAAAQEAPSVPTHYKFTALSAPFPGVYATLGYGINDLGDVVGAYQINEAPLNYPPNLIQHGYVLKKGTYTTIDVPFAGATNTVATGINNLGEVVGSYLDSDGWSHGFTLKEGVFTSFDFPGPDVLDTEASAINDAGTLVGSYYDLNSNQTRGFVLSRGKFTSIDAQFSDACCTRALGINDRDEIVGDYSQGDIPFGFTLQHDKFESFDWSMPPDYPDAFAGQNALPTGISNRGEMVGAGFRFSQGTFTPFTDMDLGSPDACGFEQACAAYGVNDWGMVVGVILQQDLSNSGFFIPQSGFLLIPQYELTNQKRPDKAPKSQGAESQRAESLRSLD